jgi:hypothetical protein
MKLNKKRFSTGTPVIALKICHSIARPGTTGPVIFLTTNRSISLSLRHATERERTFSSKHMKRSLNWSCQCFSILSLKTICFLSVIGNFTLRHTIKVQRLSNFTALQQHFQLFNESIKKMQLLLLLSEERHFCKRF